MNDKRATGKGITSRADNYSEWYNDIVVRAELADNSEVRGCMVVRPYGWRIWELLRDALDAMLRETGHENAQFTLFIPQSFLAREADHVEGFAKECAVVTHHRLRSTANGIEVDPDSKLEEPLIVRPTSETIINSQFAKWVQSYRDLPLLINQWANVVRWEMRPRLFLRTSEFFWQEGHTAHETRGEAVEETLKILEIYRRLAEEVLAMPVLCGVKSPAEKFPGAVDTYCIEAIMQDGKALQAGTSHFLGQTFAKAYGVKFQSREGVEELVWQTSWGVSTRLIGALIMVHSDDQGLVLPPRVAPHQAVVIPITRKNKDEDNARVLGFVEGFGADLRKAGVRVKVDDRDQYKPGYKFNEWELRGVPLRIEAGPRDVESGTVVVARRDGGEKQTVAVGDLTRHVLAALEDVQATLFQRAADFRTTRMHRANTYEELVETIDQQGGFVLAPWDGDAAVEERVKQDCKATIRCIREEDRGPTAKSIGSDRDTEQWAIFAKSY
jgi:prolyl-tRNA synthetase